MLMKREMRNSPSLIYAQIVDDVENSVLDVSNMVVHDVVIEDQEPTWLQFFDSSNRVPQDAPIVVIGVYTYNIVESIDTLIQVCRAIPLEDRTSPSAISPSNRCS